MASMTLPRASPVRMVPTMARPSSMSSCSALPVIVVRPHNDSRHSVGLFDAGFPIRLLLAGGSPNVNAIEEELAAEHEQPDTQCEAQRAPRNARAQQCSADCARHTARDEMQQQ